MSVKITLCVDFWLKVGIMTFIPGGYVLKKLILTSLLVLKMSTAAYAGNVESTLIPHVKKIIIDQAKGEDNYQDAYKVIKKLAKDAIEYDAGKSTPELDELFTQIEKELSFDYLELSKEQMVSLIIKAINS